MRAFRFGLTKQETEALIVMLGQLPSMLSRTRIQALPDQMASVPPANMCPFPSVVGCNPQRRYRKLGEIIFFHHFLEKKTNEIF